MGTGDFTNPDTTYFAAPQQLNKEGQIKGHNHITIEAIDSINSTKPLDPSTFIYFKGLNAAAVDGQLSANVSNGLPAGVYRISTITTGANHQCASVPVAQRGSTEDAVIVRSFPLVLDHAYFNVSSSPWAAIPTPPRPRTMAKAPPTTLQVGTMTLKTRLVVRKGVVMAGVMSGASSRGTSLLGMSLARCLLLTAAPSDRFLVIYLILFYPWRSFLPVGWWGETPFSSCSLFYLYFPSLWLRLVRVM